MAMTEEKEEEEGVRGSPVYALSFLRSSEASGMLASPPSSMSHQLFIFLFVFLPLSLSLSLPLHTGDGRG